MKLKSVVLPKIKGAGRTYKSNPWPALFEAFAEAGDAVQEISDWQEDFKNTASLYASGVHYIETHIGLGSDFRIKRRNGRVFLVDVSKQKRGKKNGLGRSAGLGTSYAYAGENVR